MWVAWVEQRDVTCPPTAARRTRRWWRACEPWRAAAWATARSARLVGAAGTEVAPSWRDRRPSGDRRAEPEGGEASEVLGGGEKVEIGVDFAGATDACSSPAVLASHHVTELALDLGAGGPVVRRPLGVLLLGAGIGEALLIAADSDGAAPLGVGALGAERAGAAGVGEVGDAVSVATPPDPHGHLVGAGDGAIVEVDGEAVLGEEPAGGGGRLGLASRVDVVCGQPAEELAGAVGGVAIHGGRVGGGVLAGLLGPATLERGPAGGPPGSRPLRPSGVGGLLVLGSCPPALAPTPTALVAPRGRGAVGPHWVVGHCTVFRPVFVEVVDEVFGHAGIAGVARRDHCVGDDLAVGVHRQVALVAIEAAGGGLVAVAGLGVHGGDHPVLGHPAGDAKGAVIGLLQVLAHHLGQQLGRLAQLDAKLPALQHRQAREGVAGPGVDERVAGLGVVPVDLGLGRAGVVVAASKRR